MKRTIITVGTITLATLVFATVTAIPVSMAQETGQTTPTDTPTEVVHGRLFIDEDGDGFNDLAPDADGDGIPNGQDSDYVKPQDGTGQRKGKSGSNAGGKAYNRANGSGNGSPVHQQLRNGSGRGRMSGKTGGNGSGSRGIKGKGRGGSPE